MGVDRVSTYALFQSTLGNVSRVDVQLATLQNQISSGFKSSNFAGMAAGTTQFLQLEDKLSRTNQYLSNNTIIGTRVSTTNTVLSQVIETATSFRNLIAQRRSGSASDDLSFQAQIDSVWRTLVGQLNTTADGRYIFAGGRTDTPPLDEGNFPALPTNGVPSDSYYAGDNQDLSVRISDNVEITYNIRANESGFQKVMAALALVQKGIQTGSDTYYAQAYDIVSEGLDEVVSLQAVVNSNDVSIKEISQETTLLKTYWLGVKDDIANTDIVAASTQVAINQGILQAAFQSFARITSLRLADYLR